VSQCLVTGNIKDLFNLRAAEKMRRVRQVYNSGTVRFTLCRQPRTSLKPVVLANSHKAAQLIYDFDVMPDGSFSGKLESNDGLEPEKTFYEVSFMVPNFRHAPMFYRVLGARLDLNKAERFTAVSADVWVND
jgi:hypothetical protein